MDEISEQTKEDIQMASEDVQYYMLLGNYKLK